MVLKF
jgi:hypothetical protein